MHAYNHILSTRIIKKQMLKMFQKQIFQIIKFIFEH
jgi:hypothetical protein